MCVCVRGIRILPAISAKHHPAITYSSLSLSLSLSLFLGIVVEAEPRSLLILSAEERERESERVHLRPRHCVFLMAPGRALAFGIFRAVLVAAAPRAHAPKRRDVSGKTRGDSGREVYR